MAVLTHRALLKVLLLLLLNICLLQRDTEISAQRKNKVQNRLVGGQTTRITHLPYLVNLRRGSEGLFFCAGTLVSRRFVVTAAHCVSGITTPRTLTVVAGANTLTSNGIQSRVTKIFIPRGWNSQIVSNDVAVLKLARRLRGRNVRPIPLCNHTLKPGMQVRVSGWGTKSEQTGQLSHRVRTMRVPLISRKRCMSNYRVRAVITRSMMCAGIPGSRDSCKADSGGPLVHRGQLCGVVSWGIGCARTNSPGVYTIINLFRGFILNSMRK